MHLRLIAIFLCAGANAAKATEPESRKTWKFPIDGGTTQIVLTTFSETGRNRRSTLEIWSESPTEYVLSGTSYPTEKTEAAFLDKAIGDLSREDLTTITNIQFRLLEPDAIKAVAIYAAQSKKWRPVLRTKSIPVVYNLVTTIINERRAYQDWADLFRKHGLTIKAVGIEELIMQPFDKSGATCPSRPSVAG